VLPLAAPSPYILQLALSCITIFVAPSLGDAAIAGVLKSTAHSPGGGIANGHCSLSHGFRPPTRLPAPPNLIFTAQPSLPNSRHSSPYRCHSH